MAMVFGGAEALCRWTLPPAGPVHVLKPGLRWAQPPNQRNTPWGEVRSGTEFFVSTDADGLRLPFPDTAYVSDDDDRTTIVYLGDSIIFGWGIRDIEAIPSQLEYTLRMRDPQHQYQVINGGQPGYSSMQSFLLYTHVLAQYKPDHVVLQLAEHNLSPRTTPDSQSISVDATTAWNLKLLGASRLYREMHKHIVNWMAGPPKSTSDAPVSLTQLLKQKGGLQTKNHHDPSTPLSVQSRVPPEELREILEAMSHMAQDLGFHLSVYFEGKGRPHEELAPWTDVIDELEAQQKLAHLQIYDELQWALRNQPYLFLAHDPGHYNPFGARVFAEIIANALTRPASNTAEAPNPSQ